ncbi:hypothetical protein LCGC14_2321200, partial [marine sediment metagenome]
DVLSEIISPEFILIALPFAGVGVRGLTGVAKVTRIVANLTVGTDIGLARGFPLLRPANVRVVLRSLTLVARSPLAIRNVPNVLDNPVFQRGLANIRKVRAGLVGRFGTPEDYLHAIGADNPVRVNRVFKDLAQNLDSIPDNLPLREAIEADLMAGRSAADIIETGVTTPKGIGKPGTLAEGAVAEFWRGEEGGGGLGRLFPHTDDGAVVDRALGNVAAGDHVGVKLHRWRRVVNNTLSDPMPAEMLERASTSDLVTLAQAARDPKNRTLVRAAKRVHTRLEKGAFPELNRVMQTPTSTVRRAQGQLMNAFDPEFGDLAVREKELQKVLAGFTEGKASTRDPFLRQVFTEDAAFVEWSFRMQNVADFKDPLWITGKDEVVDMLRTLTGGHRGTIEQRLAKLPLDTAEALKKEVRAHIKALGGTLSEDAKRGFNDRLLTMRLDMHDASVLGKGEYRFDAGRRLKVLIESSGADQLTIDRSFKGLAYLVEQGKAPPAELLKALEQTMGTDALRELMKARKLSERGMEVFYDVIGLPRVLMATADLSALLRQGGVLAPGHPFIWGSAAKDS